MIANFNQSLAAVLKYEGGWSDHPSDPGGATMAGITQKTYAAWLGRPVTRAELRAIPKGHVRAIYRQLYWRRAGCDKLPGGVDFCVFDLSVNSGPRRAIWFLQRAVNVSADRKFGAVTLAAARALPAATIIDRVCDDRLAWMRRLRRGRLWAAFGKGWGDRVEKVRAAAHAMADKPADIALSAPSPKRQGGNGLNWWERVKRWVF